MRIFQLIFIFCLCASTLKAQLSDHYKNYIQRSATENPAILIQEIDRLDTTKLENILLKGELYFYAGNNSKAQQIIDEGIKRIKKENLESSFLYTRALSNKGLILWNDGKYEKAISYLKEVLNIQNELKFDAITLSETYNNLGLVTKSINSDEAQQYFLKALSLISENADDVQKEVFITINLALIDIEKKAYIDALRRLNLILQEWKKDHKEQLPIEAFIILNIGEIHFKLGDYIIAEEQITEAINIYKTFYGLKNSELANAYMLLGRLYTQQGSFKKAIEANHNALMANSVNYNANNPNSDLNPLEAIKPGYQMAILIEKAIIYEKYYFAYSLKKEHLLLALQALEDADALVQQLRNNTTNKKDQLTLNKNASKIYEAGQRVSIYLNDITLLGKEYLYKAFEFSEKAKASNLLNALAESEAKAFGNIPMDKLKEETTLKNTLAFYSTNLAKASNEKELKTAQTQLFKAQKAYEDFIDQLEKDYPSYFNLKHSKAIASVNQVQSQLSSSELLISYSFDVETNRIYQYIIGHDSFELNIIYELAELQKFINAYRNILTYKVKAPFEHIANQLYTILIPKKVGKGIDKMIFIPEGELGIIPFEAFISEKDETNEYNSFNYLIKKYAVSYNYSATLHSTAKASPKMKASLVIAPVNFEDPKINSLPGSEKEAVAISNLFEATGYVNKLLTFSNASEENFKSPNIAAYEYIHLATHGLVNADQPDLSTIYLSSSIDGKQDGKLYVGEIYNLNLNTNLLCLSACETGIGKFSRGEGILGLGRAFSYAGVNKIVVSQWKVNDASTAIFMESFYQNTTNQEELGISKSLQKAKLTMINGTYSNPYYWAPFVLWGNSK